MFVKYEKFFSYVSNHTGMEIKHLSDIESIYNSLNIQVIFQDNVYNIITIVSISAVKAVLTSVLHR